MNDKLRFLFDHGLMQDGASMGPHSVEIDPTNRCPIDCSFCTWSQLRARTPASLSEDVFRRLIDDLIGLNVRGIVFTGGGEPLAHSFTGEAIARARAGGVSVGLFTSGVPLGPKLSSLILPHLSWIRFNLSAPDRQTYLRIHGVDLFDHVVENITRSVRLRNQHNLNVKLGIGCVLHRRRTDRDIGLLAQLASRLNLDFIQFKHDLNEMGTVEYEDWWKREVLPHLRDATNTNNSTTRIEYSERTYSRPPKEPCFIVKKMAAIKADGTVCLCKLHRDTTSMEVGNINNTSFRDIWMNDCRQEILAMLEQEGCSTCCSYKDINQYAHSVQQGNGNAADQQVIQIESGIRQFGEDINFL
jgi:MoaA/NifB/PqqE/SkfB family radical SAM enzyme